MAKKKLSYYWKRLVALANLPGRLSRNFYNGTFDNLPGELARN